MKWCTLLTVRNETDFKRIIHCSDESIRFLSEDALEIGLKKRGYDIVSIDTIGWVDEIAITEVENTHTRELR